MYGTPMDMAAAIMDAIFGHPSFRDGQRRAIEAALEGRDVLVVLPTGGGKSICYQVPALVHRMTGGGLTVVVSPLIALMEDQVRALRSRGVAAVALHSNLDTDARRRARDEARTAALLYCSPERLAIEGTRQWLDHLGVELLAIDEAHCISEWGHDFRTDYLRLGELKERWCCPVVALTATATPRVEEEIVSLLGLVDPVRVKGSLLRPDLRFSVEWIRGDKARVARVIDLLHERGLGRRPPGKALIYTESRKRVVAIARELRAAGYRVAHYHAGRTESARANAQARFLDGRARIMVATSAFGMGIDLPDIRLVAHVGLPPSLETYAQQAGRAGRDGSPADAVLLASPKDIAVRHCVVKSPTPSEEDGFRAMLAYARCRGCRQVELARRFGETVPLCRTCDICTDPDAVPPALERGSPAQPPPEPPVELDDDAHDLIVEMVRHLHRPVGKRVLAMALRGSKAAPVRKARLLDNPCHGALRGIPEPAVVRAVEGLLEEGRLARRGRKYPTVWLPGKPVRKRRSKRGDRPPRPPLERALRALRRRESRRRRWKPYAIFDDATLERIVQARPQTLDALLAIRGMGPTRAARYGEAIIELVRVHAALPDEG